MGHLCLSSLKVVEAPGHRQSRPATAEFGFNSSIPEMSQSPSRRASLPTRPFDASDLGTYTLDILHRYSLVDLVQLLNDLPRNITSTPASNVETMAKINVLRAICVGFAEVRRHNDARTLQRTAMFAADDVASRIRPSIGLKRTYPPGIFSTAITVSNSEDEERNS
ncbi:UL35 capsid protein [Meleagrid alphaherpesvirus 1]|nr:UL35 capsid protein [Meleagrid alphaherpesvirus 1]